MTLVIRPARFEDAATILDHIRRLSVYEKLAHEVTAGIRDIEATLFCPEPRVFCELAEWNGESAGFALWFYNYSTFLGRHGLYLEDLFVRDEFRGHGIGKRLLARLAKRCVDEKLGRFEWSVLDWNEPAIQFYESQGAVVQKEWYRCRMTGDPLKALARQS